MNKLICQKMARFDLQEEFINSRPGRSWFEYNYPMPKEEPPKEPKLEPKVENEKHYIIKKEYGTLDPF